MTLFFRQPLEDENNLAALFPDSDFIIAEGFKPDGSLRVEVTGSTAAPSEMKNPASGVDVIVYGNTELAYQLRHKSFPKDCNAPTASRPFFLQRDDIRSAADFFADCRSIDKD